MLLKRTNSPSSCRSRSPALVVALALLTHGCSEGEDAESRRVVTDSAGVEVVHISPPDEIQEAEPTVVLEIGSADGPEESQLAEVAGALRLPNGTVAVADGGTKQIRFFDSTGVYLFAQGREGEGPAEYRSFGYLGLLGDTILVYDGRLQRLSLLDESGQFLSAMSLEGATLPSVAGRLGSGHLVTWLRIPTKWPTQSERKWPIWSGQVAHRFRGMWPWGNRSEATLGVWT